ncbi:MAG TPA: hypothetical protein PLV25_02250, partial [Opitutales bacterium]|nr:hypothetical protein [Opitutales bacterium]
MFSKCIGGVSNRLTVQPFNIPKLPVVFTLTMLLYANMHGGRPCIQFAVIDSDTLSRRDITEGALNTTTTTTAGIAPDPMVVSDEQAATQAPVYLFGGVDALRAWARNPLRMQHNYNATLVSRRFVLVDQLIGLMESAETLEDVYGLTLSIMRIFEGDFEYVQHLDWNRSYRVDWLHPWSTVMDALQEELSNVFQMQGDQAPVALLRTFTDSLYIDLSSLFDWLIVAHPFSDLLKCENDRRLGQLCSIMSQEHPEVSQLSAAM